MSWDETPEGYINVPKPFDGSKEQLDANLASHRWSITDPEEPPECDRCACKLGTTHSRYACGANVPRVLVKQGSNQARRAILNSIGLPASAMQGGSPD